MKMKEFNALKKGDIVWTKNRKAQVVSLGYTLIEIQYLDTGRKAWKSARQITTRREGG